MCYALWGWSLWSTWEKDVEGGGVTVDIARWVDFICLLAMGQQTQFQLYYSSGSSPLAHNSSSRNICNNIIDDWKQFGWADRRHNTRHSLTFCCLYKGSISISSFLPNFVWFWCLTDHRIIYNCNCFLHFFFSSFFFFFFLFSLLSIIFLGCCKASGLIDIYPLIFFFSLINILSLFRDIAIASLFLDFFPPFGVSMCAHPGPVQYISLDW